jgi:hypothetical protein
MPLADTTVQIRMHRRIQDVLQPLNVRAKQGRRVTQLHPVDASAWPCCTSCRVTWE